MTRYGYAQVGGRGIEKPEMVLIPAGEFLMGSNPRKDRYADDEEQPQHTLYLPDYYIARTPVTNAQYAAFVQATGHRQPEHWEGGKPPEGEEDHPVVYVSWYDAVAYCKWLSQVTGKPYRLPSEAEWEKAARGTDGRIYPWGDEFPDEERCNWGNVYGTTPVGRYSPQGDSPYGCTDMAVSVWEWTRSLHRYYPYDPGDGREDLEASDVGLLVWRGDAFDVSAYMGKGRCAFRQQGSALDRNWKCGFRVVVSPVRL